jgi:hypothetical protein
LFTSVAVLLPPTGVIRFAALEEIVDVKEKGRV